ncbi:MAG: hypothetical protein ABI947_15460 [Chloroflexota bacterium]
MLSAPIRTRTEGLELPTVTLVKTDMPVSTATPIATINDPKLLPHAGTATPIATISDPKLLPQAMTATPSPYKSNRSSKSTLSSENQALLDNAVSSSFSASALQFTIKALIKISTQGETGTLQIEGTGYASHLDDLQKFVLQSKLTLTFDLNGAKRVLNVEERIIKGNFYLYVEEPATRIKTKWIGISFSDLLANFFQGFGAFVPSLEGVTKMINDKVPDASELLDLLSFAAYFNTTRIDKGDPEAQFRTQADLLGFLKSKDDLTAALTVLARLGSINLKPAQVAGVVTIFQKFLPFLIPDLRLTTDIFVDTSDGKVSRLTLDFRTTFRAGDFSTLKTQLVTLTISGSAALGSYGVELQVDVPPDVVIVKSLDKIPTDALLVPMTTITATAPGQ